MSYTDYEQRRKRIVELLQNDELSGYDIDTKIMEEFECSRDAARKARKRLLGNAEASQEVEHAEETRDSVQINWGTREYDCVLFTSKWDKETGKVKRHAKHKSIPFAEMQDYVWQYTHAGNGLTRAKTCQHIALKYNRNISTDELRRIFRCIDIYKTSNPIAPHRYEENSQEENAQHWRERDEATLEAKYRSNETKHLKKMLRKKAIKLNETRDFIIECVEGVEFSQLPDLKPHNSAPAVITRNHSVGDFQIGEWHFGYQIDSDHNQYNPEIAELRIAELVQKFADFVSANGNRFGKYRVVLLGDMVDGIHGDIQTDQHLHQSIRGVDQAVGCADLLTAFLREAYKIVGRKLHSVEAVPGNHGRDSRSWHGDPQRTPEILMYHIAKGKADLPDVQWNITHGPSTTVEWREHGRRFVAGHGDKDKIKDIAWTRLRRGEHIVFYCGHRHEVMLSGLYGANYTMIQNGCVCGSTDHAIRKGYHALPAQTLVEVTPETLTPHPFFLLEHGGERW